MVDEKDAKEIAERFIKENWDVSVEAQEIIFRSADNQTARIEALVTNKDASVFHMFEQCRDSWSVSFPTILKDGTAFADPTFVDVAAQSGVPSFAE